ncbi:carboxymuconolactone decarboxylase family protein [Alcanivorax marinus]|nr:carboxymuconolactone decarboxylase family protein [Alloalcanivorax marinus]
MRLPPTDKSIMNTEQMTVADEIIAGPRGRLTGPFHAWIHSPDFATHAQRLGSVCRYQSGLPTRLAELAVLVTAAHWRSMTEWRIHHPIAVESGLSPAALEAIRTGVAPDFDAPDEQFIYRFTKQLHHSSRVSDHLFEEAIGRFGLRVVVNLVGLIGYYTCVAMTLNVFEIQVDD